MAYKSKTKLLEINSNKKSYCSIDPALVASGKIPACKLHFHSDNVKDTPKQHFKDIADRSPSLEDDPNDDIVSINEYAIHIEDKETTIIHLQGEMRTDDYLEALGENAVTVLKDDSHLTKYAIIDFETTGGRAETSDRAVQIAIIHLDENGEITDRWSTFINPEREVEFTEIHGVTQEMADNAPLFKDVAEEILSRLEGRAIAAHNASYDLRYLKAEFARLGMKAEINPKNTVCTMQVAKRFLGEDLPSTKLADCIEKAGISYVEEEGRGAHDASVDAVATARLLGYYIKNKNKDLNDERFARAEKAKNKK